MGVEHRFDVELVQFRDRAWRVGTDVGGSRSKALLLGRRVAMYSPGRRLGETFRGVVPALMKELA